MKESGERRDAWLCSQKVFLGNCDREREREKNDEAYLRLPTSFSGRLIPFGFVIYSPATLRSNPLPSLRVSYTLYCAIRFARPELALFLLVFSFFPFARFAFPGLLANLEPTFYLMVDIQIWFARGVTWRRRDLYIRCSTQA